MRRAFQNANNLRNHLWLISLYVEIDIIFFQTKCSKSAHLLFMLCIVIVCGNVTYIQVVQYIRYVPVMIWQKNNEEEEG